MSLYHAGGDPSIDSWGEEWNFTELTTAEAMAILNVREDGVILFFSLILSFSWLAKISINPCLRDPLLIKVEFNGGQCPEGCPVGNFSCRLMEHSRT